MVDLSIIIPCYIANDNLLQLTRNTLDSFRNAILPEYEVIIIDDCSPMGGGYLRSEADRYLLHKQNAGFSKSVNDGMNLARGKYVVLANNDIRVAPNFYQAAKEILDTNDKVYSVHPRMCFYDDPLVLGSNTYLSGKERWCQSSFFITRNGDIRFPEHFIGIGGAYEDWYYQCMIRKKGWQTAYTTKTCFQHKDSSTNQVIGEHSKFHTENKELFKAEFGDYPEPYFASKFSDQVQMDWRGEFQKL